MGIFALCTLFFAPSVANAQSFEVNLNTAILGTSDEDFDTLSDTTVMPSQGVDLGFEVADNLNVLIGFHTGTVGKVVYTQTMDGNDSATIAYEDSDGHYDYDSYSYGYEDSSFHIASTVNQLKAGVRYRFDATRRVTMTLTSQAILAHANLRMDEDIEMEGSEVEVTYNAFAPGFTAAGGVEWAPLIVGESRINVGVEAGYGHILGLDFKERDAAEDPISVGSLNLNGTFARMYIGTRF
jgi:hypothetical protein